MHAMSTSTTARSPSFIEVAFVMTQSILRQLMIVQRQLHPRSSTSLAFEADGPLWKTVLAGLRSDQHRYCQQLAKVVVQMSSRTTEGKLIDCQLDAFLKAFPEPGLPSKISDLPLVNDLDELLFNMFMKATKLLLEVDRGNQSVKPVAMNRQTTVNQRVNIPQQPKSFSTDLTESRKRGRSNYDDSALLVEDSSNQDSGKSYELHCVILFDYTLIDGLYDEDGSNDTGYQEQPPVSRQRITHDTEIAIVSPEPANVRLRSGKEQQLTRRSDAKTFPIREQPVQVLEVSSAKGKGRVKNYRLVVLVSFT